MLFRSCMSVAKAMAEIGNPNSVTDAGVGALAARAGVVGKKNALKQVLKNSKNGKELEANLKKLLECEMYLFEDEDGMEFMRSRTGASGSPVGMPRASDTRCKLSISISSKLQWRCLCPYSSNVLEATYCFASQQSCQQIFCLACLLYTSRCG